jgi:Tol biopolymer transport system component
MPAPRRIARLASLALALAIVTPIGFPPAANASFPGINGKLAFTGTSNWEIHTINPDGSNEAILTDSGRFNDTPAWSADGTKIAFAREINYNNDYDIFVIDANGANEHDITLGRPASERAPTWTPDGRIVFTSAPYPNGGLPQIYVMNADGSNVLQVTNDTDIAAEDPVVSPDGSLIVFVDGFITYSLFETDFSGRERVLWDGPGVASSPEWSPDGKKIVFMRQRARKKTIWVINRGGHGATMLSNISHPRDEYPTWSPDGTQIAFIRYGDVYVMNADGTNPVDIAPSTSTEVELRWGPMPTAG